VNRCQRNETIEKADDIEEPCRDLLSDDDPDMLILWVPTALDIQYSMVRMMCDSSVGAELEFHFIRILSDEMLHPLLCEPVGQLGLGWSYCC
jgi:hypothetical protein